jgi:hypothetical protein
MPYGDTLNDRAVPYGEIPTVKGEQQSAVLPGAQPTASTGGGGGGGKRRDKEPSLPGAEYTFLNAPAGTLMPDPSAPENLPPGYELGDFNDPYNAYLSTVPVMELTRDYQIGDAMAKAGFTGNRYSTDAQAMAGRIGAETSLAMQAKLMDLLYNQSNQDLNRALQAAQSGGQLGIGIDALQRGRLGELSQFGTYEQGRIDDIARILFGDYRAEEYGLLPELIGASSSAVGVPYSDVFDLGSPGAQQWLSDILPLIAAFL